MESNSEIIIEQTKKWIHSVVIECNFCPFAAKVMFKNQVQFIVEQSSKTQKCLQTLHNELKRLNNDPETETSFIILTEGFKKFKDYLRLVTLTEELLTENNYDGVYQIASFHPDYCFQGAELSDPANYTNRSVYPMLHILREESLTKALSLYPHPEQIPEHNIEFARKKGLIYMQALRQACF